ncbi:MAG: (4Fe-4S)-binding protein [Saprospiraceae bacterium]|nr:(4Fe-4S)-binding protein [Saprospiraceae bacterium]
MSDTERRFTNEDLTVIWKSSKCIHSGNCVAGLKQVFDPQRRPWIDLTQADKDSIIKQVDLCPSGALTYELEALADSGVRSGGEVEVEVFANGPLALKAACVISLPDGREQVLSDTSYFCRCGGSGNKPFCDGSHKKIDFQG